MADTFHLAELGEEAEHRDYLKIRARKAVQHIVSSMQGVTLGHALVRLNSIDQHRPQATFVEDDLSDEEIKRVIKAGLGRDEQFSG